MKSKFLKMSMEYGKIEGQKGFHYWFIGGPNFGDTPGDFEGPYKTAALAKAAAKEQAAIWGTKLTRNDGP